MIRSTPWLLRAALAVLAASFAFSMVAKVAIGYHGSPYTTSSQGGHAYPCAWNGFDNGSVTTDKLWNVRANAGCDTTYRRCEFHSDRGPVNSYVMEQFNTTVDCNMRSSEWAGGLDHAECAYWATVRAIGNYDFHNHPSVGYCQ